MRYSSRRSPAFICAFTISEAMNPSNRGSANGDRPNSAADLIPSRWHASPESAMETLGDLISRLPAFSKSDKRILRYPFNRSRW